MSRSNAPREKLLKPWHLLLAVMGFGAAFVWIAPNRQALTLEEASVDSSISELDVAYLRAQRASEQQSAEDVLKAATALVRAQRISEAEALLADQPDVRMSKTDEYALTLERVIVELNNELTLVSDDRTKVNQLENSLRVTLNEIVKNQEITRIELFVRGKEISRYLNDHRLTGDYSLRLASVDSARSSQWFGDCAKSFELANEISQALECVVEQGRASTTAKDRFTAKVHQLTLLTKVGDRPQADRVIDELFDSEGASVEGLSFMAKQMLAIERPLDAARAYAQLSSKDPANANQWLQQAARWAEAGGEPGEAAAYLDILRDSSDAPEVDKHEHEAEISRLLSAAGNNQAIVKRYQKRIEAGDTSESTLHEAVKFALSTNDISKAQQWSDLLVQTHPESIVGWIAQYDLAMANTQLSTALTAANTLVDLQPAEVEHHVRLAKVAEWSGDPDLATAQWLWISERYPSTESLTELTRLAKLTLRPTITAEALRQLVMRKIPTSSELAQLVTAYELEGQPEKAASALESVIAKYGNSVSVMKRLAQLHERHVNFSAAAGVWAQYEKDFGRSVVSRLHRMEFSWRLNQSVEATKIAKTIPVIVGDNPRLLDQASDYQIRLLSEIAWRYDIPELNVISEPQFVRIEEKDRQTALRTRAIEIAHEQGRLSHAISSAEALYADTESVFSALLHMRLLTEAMRIDVSNNDKYQLAFQPYLAGNSSTLELRKNNAYWSLVATFHLSQGDEELAERAYRSALVTSPENADALTGLLWMYIGTNQLDEVRGFVDKYESVANNIPSLWTPFAMAYMQLGRPGESLTWFERQINTIEADYGVLLTYADALEASGQTEYALKVRHYAINALRPLLTNDIDKDQNALLKQYARMVARFGNSDQMERFTQGVLDKTGEKNLSKDQFWQQEMAITWLMATQRHDFARVVIAKLHEQRLQAPAWQALAVAMKQNDLDTVAQIVQSGQGISVGDNILALRQLNRGNEAYALAIRSIQSGLSGNDRLAAEDTYRALRQYRPGFAGAAFSSTHVPDLDVLETSVVARHTFAGSTLGVSIDARRQQFDSARYGFDDEDELTNLAVTLHYGDIGLNSRITAGYVSDAEVDRTYAIAGLGGRFGNGRHTFGFELAADEIPNSSTLLQLRGKQNRASALVDFSVGKLGFVKLSADALDISTRVSERKVARGLSSLAEFGVRGTMGSHSWSSSIAASSSVNNRTTDVPDELALNPQVTMNEVIGEKLSTLSFGASLSRGNVAENYPQVSSPRYFLNARVGHQWPQRNIGLQFDAGAGVRIIGGDELSVGFSHDGLVNDIVGDGRSRVGVNYRFHF